MASKKRGGLSKRELAAQKKAKPKVSTRAVASYKITMNQLFLNLNTNNGTSDSATTSLTVPFASVNEYSFANALAIDNGSVVAAANRAVISIGAATLTFYKDMASTGWTTSGTKRVAHIANYEI